jgi:hypothetical protein
MIYSDVSLGQGIVQDIDFLLFGSSTATSPYAIADKTRNINSWYDTVANLIMKSDNRWEWDDNNKTDLPIATTALVADQQDYAISGASFLKVLKVEIKDANGNWQPLTPISLDDKRNESMTDYQKTAGTPREYDKLGNSIFIYPKPNYSQAASLKVFYQRNVTHFTVSDTTAVPGFAENFHRILSYGASLDYAIAHSMNNKINTLLPLITAMQTEIANFYAGRGHDEKLRMTSGTEDYGQSDTGYEGEIGVIGN